VGDFDNNLLEKLGLNSWFLEEKQPGVGSRVPARLARPKTRRFFGSRGISGNRCDQPGLGAHGPVAWCAWCTGNVLSETETDGGPNGKATERAEPHEKDRTALAAIVENSRMRSDRPLLHGEITSSIIDSFFDVHGELGFGFREYIYARALERLLIEKGHTVDREVAVMSTSAVNRSPTSEWTWSSTAR
jgi:hypothetical protein